MQAMLLKPVEAHISQTKVDGFTATNESGMFQTLEDKDNSTVRDPNNLTNQMLITNQITESDHT